MEKGDNLFANPEKQAGEKIINFLTALFDTGDKSQYDIHHTTHNTISIILKISENNKHYQVIDVERTIREERFDNFEIINTKETILAELNISKDGKYIQLAQNSTTDKNGFNTLNNLLSFLKQSLAFREHEKQSPVIQQHHDFKINTNI